MLQISGFEEFFGDLQILSARVVEQALLRIKLRQPQHAFQCGFQLGELLVHGDGFDGEALGSISIANALEADNRLVIMA